MGMGKKSQICHTQHVLDMLRPLVKIPPHCLEWENKNEAVMAFFQMNQG